MIKDLTCAGPGGDINLRLYDAREDRDPGPVITFYHGGGFVIGDLDTHNALCTEIAAQMDLPVVAVSSLAALAYPYVETGHGVIASVDARMGELYTGVYTAQEGELISLSDELLIKPERMTTSIFYDDIAIESWRGVGSGWDYRESFGNIKALTLLAVDTEALPTAAAVVALAMGDFDSGNTVTAADVRPIYLRDSVAWKKKT